MTTVAKIIERGNGFPRRGGYVTDGDTIYRITWIGGAIYTDDSRGNYAWAHVEEADWTDCAEIDQHDAIVTNVHEQGQWVAS